jgi:hypothetical protein
LMCFPGKVLRYFLNDSEMVPLAPVTSGIILVFLPRCIFIVRPLYFRIHLQEVQCIIIIIIIIII